MTGDARFEDADDKPLRLIGAEAGDVEVFSSLLQDAIFSASDAKFDKSRRQFALLLNRFRWEADQAAAERTRAVLMVDDVLRVRSQGVLKNDSDTVYSTLALEWAASEEGAGRLSLILAGDGEIELSVESINLTLRDVTRPYTAPSGNRPSHPD